MVTDEQYRKLENRVDELEKKLLLLSKQYSSLYMKKDVLQMSGSSSSPEKNRRDTTRYTFDDHVYCKRDLVLACVRKYADDHPGITGAELTEVFPDYVQGSLGIVRKVIEAERYSNANGRFFFSDSDILYLPDGRFVVCAQWDKNNIDRFVALVADFGYMIEAKKRKY